MRIENLMKCAMFFPYAGLTETRGWELKPNKISGELPPTRFFNELLQKDWKAGKIKIYVNAQDSKLITNEHPIDSTDNSLIAPTKLVTDNKVTPNAIKDIPLVSEQASLSENIAKYTDKMNKVALPVTENKPAVTKEPMPAVEPINIDTAAISLSDLNNEKTGVPNFPKEAPKAKLDEIATFMKGPIG